MAFDCRGLSTDRKNSSLSGFRGDASGVFAVVTWLLIIEVRTPTGIVRFMSMLRDPPWRESYLQDRGLSICFGKKVFEWASAVLFTREQLQLNCCCRTSIVAPSSRRSLRRTIESRIFDEDLDAPAASTPRILIRAVEHKRIIA